MPDDGYTRITLRIPTDLDEKLTESAKATSKSKNAEIIARLQASLSDDQLFSLANMPNIEAFAREVAEKALADLVQKFVAAPPGEENTPIDLEQIRFTIKQGRKKP